MKIGKFIKTIIYAPRIIPFVAPKVNPQKEQPGIPVEIPQKVSVPVKR